MQTMTFRIVSLFILAALAWFLLFEVASYWVQSIPEGILDGVRFWGFAAITVLAVARSLANQRARHKNVERALSESEREFRLIIRNMPDVFYRTDREGRLLMLSPSVTDLSGYSMEEMIGRPLDEFYANPADRERVLRAIENGKGEPVQVEVALTRKDGKIIWASSHSFVRFDEAGEPIGVEGVARDITERKLMEERLRHLAGHDFLTDLPNRMEFGKRLDAAIARARRADTMVALLVLDLDGFKEVNDTMGHSAGDALLKMVAKRLIGFLRVTDLAGRMGGDEFSIILEGDVSRDSVAIVARKIIDSLSEPFDISATQVKISASIGISFFPKEGEDGSTLIRRADQAMYQAKALGKHTFQFWNPPH